MYISYANNSVFNRIHGRKVGVSYKRPIYKPNQKYQKSKCFNFDILSTNKAYKSSSLKDCNYLYLDLAT